MSSSRCESSCCPTGSKQVKAALRQPYGAPVQQDRAGQQLDEQQLHAQGKQISSRALIALIEPY